MQQARYPVKHHQPELWAHVLVGGNMHYRQLIKQIIPTALPESKVFLLIIEHINIDHWQAFGIERTNELFLWSYPSRASLHLL